MNEFEKRYKNLNAAQKQAVDTIDGPVMVVAGPGTGKTELMSMRVARILKETDTLPEHILCLTFTDSGAQAMRDRLISIIGPAAYKVAIHTFHSFGSEIISQYREHFYRGALFQPADELRQLEMISSILNELPHDNPLSSTMNGQHTYLHDVKTVISELKRSGLSSEQFLEILERTDEDIDHIELLLKDIFAQRMSAKAVASIQAALEKLQQHTVSSQTLYEIPSLVSVAAASLEAALAEVESTGKTPALTAWKKQWFSGTGESFGLKAREQSKKLHAVSSVYYSYLTRMEGAGLYDFDDMILQVVQQLEHNDDLRFSLQEKFLYISVDEFQDTNLAQMRIIHSLTNNPASEGKPNILVVGDDDQAIYSFQGANVSNILNFKQHYPATKIITLTDNYRSTDPVLQHARDVIVKGVERLETSLENITKQLTGHSSDPGSVSIIKAATIEDERRWLIEDIKRQLKQGTDPQDIAVFTRQHHELKALLPYFEAASIPVSYEFQDDALAQPPIKALLLLARTVVALAGNNHAQADAYLPELLTHPAWEIAAHELWELSVEAYDSRKRWLDIMAIHPRWQDIHNWLITLAKDSLHAPAEIMIDRMIGASEENKGPFYRYFFSPDTLDDQPYSYLLHLSALTTIRDRLCQYRPEGQLTLKEFLEFIELNKRFGRSIRVTQQSNPHQGVQLMTAHKAKGLEFPRVYIFNCVETVWGESARGKNRLISYPYNLALAEAGNTSDDKLRLLYVALTRAKHDLAISYSSNNEKGKPTMLVGFLAEKESESVEIKAPTDLPTATKAAELVWTQQLTEPSTQLQDVLRPILERYKLSPSHLSDFLDVTRGGPKQFLLDRLLHFPITPSPNAAYGSAVHAVMQQLHTQVSAGVSFPPLEDILLWFETALRRERLSPEDFSSLLQKGHDHLRIFLDQRQNIFSPTQTAEVMFDHQGVVLGEAHLTGKIDVIDKNNSTKTVVVTDYKTARPHITWKTSDGFQQVQLHQYQQQLLFYTLLVENSRDYGNFTVEQAQLEFIRPDKKGNIVEPLKVSLNDGAISRLKQLIEKVWQHIQNQSFPDTSHYDASLKGIIAFEEDLLRDVI